MRKNVVSAFGAFNLVKILISVDALELQGFVKNDGHL